MRSFYLTAASLLTIAFAAPSLAQEVPSNTDNSMANAGTVGADNGGTATDNSNHSTNSRTDSSTHSYTDSSTHTKVSTDDSMANAGTVEGSAVTTLVSPGLSDAGSVNLMSPRLPSRVTR